MGPNISDAEIQDHLATIMKPSVDWLKQRLTPEGKVNGAK